MQISLKDLLGVVTACSVVLWCASMSGFTSLTFWLNVGISAMTSTVFFAMARKRRFGLGVGLALPIAICGFIFWILTPLINAIILSVLAVALSSRERPTSEKAVAAATTTAMLVAIVFGTLPSIARVRDMRALRDEFPIVSLEKRLPYETSRNGADRSTPVAMSNSVSKTLDGFEINLASNDDRRFQLARLHSEHYDRFIRSLGFGVARRMGPVYPESIRLPALRNWRSTRPRTKYEEPGGEILALFKKPANRTGRTISILRAAAIFWMPSGLAQ